MSDPIRDSLDDAIDRVATNLVSVADDPGAVQRIVSSLPAQKGRGWWSVWSLPLQVAVAASLVLIVAYMRPTSSDDPLPLADQPSMTTAKSAPAERALEVPSDSPQVDVKPTTVPVRRAAVRRPSEVGPAFGLAAIATPSELTLRTLSSTAPLDPLEPASVPPIALSDLPLASDGQTPFSKE